MRSLVLAMVALGVTAGCAGNVADFIGPRAPIITPQLTRYGLDAERTQCVGLRLGNSLTRLQLRKFARQASAVRQSYFGGTSLLIIVVVTMDFMAQVQAYVMSHQYESLLKKANFKGGSGFPVR